MIVTAQEGSDQPHVVVEGQPADHHVLQIDGQALAIAPDVGQQVRVAQRDTPRRPRAPRGVLDQRQRVGLRGPGGRGLVQDGLGSRLDAAQPRHEPLEHRPDGPRPRVQDQGPRLGVLQDPALPEQVLRQFLDPHGRVEGNGDRSRPEGAEEEAEEVGPGGQHERDPVARLELAPVEPHGPAGGRVPQSFVGEGSGLQGDATRSGARAAWAVSTSTRVAAEAAGPGPLPCATRGSSGGAAGAPSAVADTRSPTVRARKTARSDSVRPKASSSLRSSSTRSRLPRPRSRPRSAPRPAGRKSASGWTSAARPRATSTTRTWSSVTAPPFGSSMPCRRRGSQ